MNLGQLTIAPVFPMGFILLLFALGLASSIAQYRVIRGKLGHVRALELSLLRFGTISFLVVFALNPSSVTKEEHKVPTAIAILLDTSQSMSQTGSTKEASRLDEAKALLEKGPNPLLKSLTDRFEVRLYGLGESLRAFEVDDLVNLNAGGMKGDLNDALKDISGKSALAVLFSDGNLTWDGSHPSPLPLITVPVGNPDEYKDILIKAIKAPSLAFRGRVVVVDVTIKHYGYTGLTLPILLKNGSKLLTAKNIRLLGTSGEVTASLSFIPEEVGQKNLSVSIPQQFGESLISNNSLNLSIKVVRDKIRILMVSGSPSMNYRFMRMALKNDPSVDLLSFVILRTPSDIINVPTQEQSLIPFPVETLFSKEIKTFDLLIFDNFPYSLYLSPHHLESIREYVRGGGSFAIIGGPHLVNEGSYALTPIGEILPVRFSGKEDYRRDSQVGVGVGVRLSRAGATHPITQSPSEIKGDETRPANFWREMPPLDGINLLEPKSSATVLLESADGIGWPVLTVSSFGKGRVLALATDYAWKWFAGMVAKGKGNLAYLRFVDRMVRWLTKDPSLDPVQISLPENAGTAGHETEVRIQLREEDPSPNLRSMVSFSVFNPDGLKTDSKTKPTGHPGEYLGSFLPQKEGIYKLRVETPASQIEESLVVAGPLDSLDAAPDHEQLGAISASSGGRTLSQGDHLFKEIEDLAQKGETRFIEEKRSSVWATPYVMILILSLLVIEWYYRRRWGLI